MPAAAVRQGGKIATTTATPAEETLAAADLTSSFIMAGPHREIVGPLADQAAAGDLKVNIATVLPLEKATDGLSTLASGQAKGKIVVTLDN